MTSKELDQKLALAKAHPDLAHLVLCGPQPIMSRYITRAILEQEPRTLSDSTPVQQENPDPERFRLVDDPRVERTESCWIWTGGRTGNGYGRFYHGGTESYTHRLSYEQHHGPIPDGYEVMHLCDNPPCVNPDHLRVGTHAQNMQDAMSKGRLNTENLQRRGEWEMCGKGLHPLSGDNLYINPRGVRECYACKRARRKEWRERNGR